MGVHALCAFKIIIFTYKHFKWVDQKASSSEQASFSIHSFGAHFNVVLVLYILGKIV